VSAINLAPKVQRRIVYVIRGLGGAPSVALGNSIRERKSAEARALGRRPLSGF
jgi:hypothetical protein